MAKKNGGTNMLTEKDYCDYETCVALKELGYVGICDAYYELTGNEDYNRNSFELLYTRDFIHPDDIDRVAAPLLYQAQKWLREKKLLHIVIDKLLYGAYEFSVVDILNYSEQKNGTSNSYEEALLEGIKEAIKLLKEEK